MKLPFLKAKGTDGERWHPEVYPSLFDLAAHAGALDKKGGVYVIWHRGVRPQWLRVGAGADLGSCLAREASAPAISQFRNNGGVFAAWCTPTPARWAGIVRHLTEKLRPAAQEGPVLEAAPIPFPLPHGTTGVEIPS